MARLAKTTGLLCVAVCSIGCGGQRIVAPTLPPFVTIELRGALVGPSKVGGARWDGLGHLDSAAQDGLRRALSNVDPYAAAFSFLLNPASDALERPEPFGRARVTVNGVAVQELELPLAQRDTLTPMWSNLRFNRVRLAEDTRLDVELYDKDLVNDDALGTATITATDLAAALRARTVHHVRVAEQTNNQVLFFDISVEATP